MNEYLDLAEILTEGQAHLRGDDWLSGFGLRGHWRPLEVVSWKCLDLAETWREGPEPSRGDD